MKIYIHFPIILLIGNKKVQKVSNFNEKLQKKEPSKERGDFPYVTFDVIKFHATDGKLK